MTDSRLTGIIDCTQRGIAGKKEIENLLELSAPQELELLFQAARNVRRRYFGNGIFLYGFLYFSTFCRNTCRFCKYRHANRSFPRYRKTEHQIVSAAVEMAEAGVHLIDLTMGEDPELYSEPDGFKRLRNIIKIVQEKTGLPVMISPGVIPDSILLEFAEMGVAWYACYQETHNRILYEKLRCGQGFQERLGKKQLAQSLGMLIEEGLLTGVGETSSDLADSIVWMRDFGVDQARVMTFIPQDGTPMADIAPQDNLRELVIIAVMRLVLRDVLIPASLDVEGILGLQSRLDAGANVVTSIVPPEKGLAGVANNSLDIDESLRTVDHIVPVLKGRGLTVARPEDYTIWIRSRQDILRST